LHASLIARLDRLGPAAKDVAQKGSVIGREFAYDLVAATADLPEPQQREALDRLANSGLVLARGTPPQSTYVFKHALVQDTAYSTLLRGRRRQLHGRGAATLEANFSGAMATHPEVLAYHFAEAGLAERAIKYLMEAGQRALQGSAMVEAEALLRRGPTLVPSLPEGIGRQERELDLQIALGQALIPTKGFANPAVGEA
jgi:predicted ATPase